MFELTVKLLDQDAKFFQVRLLKDSNHQIAQYAIPKTSLEELEASNARYSVASASELVKMGRDLWDWLNSGKEKLHEHLPHDNLQLTFVIEETVRSLSDMPWELLHDGRAYLCVRSFPTCCIQRRVLQRTNVCKTFTRPLRILFMACSPEGVTPVLNFEHEECGIIELTDSHPIFLHIEESGSLEGLGEQLGDYPPGFFDVLHINGHAGMDDATGKPIFLMETEEGQLDKVSADRLVELLFESKHYPRLVFVSGCGTCETPLSLSLFCEQLVRSGVPCVLGFAQPLGDIARTLAAGWLYEKLAFGQAIIPAINYARRKLYRYEEDRVREVLKSFPLAKWFLLRLYSDGSPLSALVTDPHLHAGEFLPEARRLFFDVTGLQNVYTPRNLIGRRRLLQRCVRILRFPCSHPDAVHCVLLSGMGGLGKSTTAACIADRLWSGKGAVMDKVIAWSGMIDEARLFLGLETHLDISADTLDDQIGLKVRLAHLLKRRRVLLILDDFDRNITNVDEPEVHSDECLRIISALSDAIHYSCSRSRLILTTRDKNFKFLFPLRVHVEKLGFLVGSDLQKKCIQLSLLNASKRDNLDVRLWAIRLAAGVPRLLELMKAILIETKYENLLALLKRVEDADEKFRENILIKHLLEVQSPNTRKVLACVSLFYLPQPLKVLKALCNGNKECSSCSSSSKRDVFSSQPVIYGCVPCAIKCGQAAGLIESHSGGYGECYVVPSLLRIYLEKYLHTSARQRTLCCAAQALYHFYQSKSNNEWVYREILRLAMEGAEKEITISAGYYLTSWLLNENRWQAVRLLCTDILEHVKDFRIIGNLAYAEFRLGWTERALFKFKAAFALISAHKIDELSADVVVLKSHYVALLCERRNADNMQPVAELEKAMSILKTELLPVYGKLGDLRGIAISIGRIADIKQARGELDDALRMVEDDVLPLYEKLGDYRGIAISKGKIADIKQARGELYDALRMLEDEVFRLYAQLGDMRGIAIAKGKIADIKQARGELDDALRMVEDDVLPLYEELGDYRGIAISKGKIADIKQARGELYDALRMLEDEVLPVYENLGDMRGIAIAKGKIADIKEARGELGSALRIRRIEELPLYEELGDFRGIERTKGKIGDIL